MSPSSRATAPVPSEPSKVCHYQPTHLWFSAVQSRTWPSYSCGHGGGGKHLGQIGDNQLTTKGLDRTQEGRALAGGAFQNEYAGRGEGRVE